MYRKVVGTHVVIFPSPLWHLRDLTTVCVRGESAAALRQPVSVSRPSAPGLNKAKSKDQSTSLFFYSHMGLRGLLLPVNIFRSEEVYNTLLRLHFIMCADPQFIARRYSSYRFDFIADAALRDQQ